MTEKALKRRMKLLRTNPELLEQEDREAALKE